eukprot:10150277-Alexandrium_andersonii.AAC.1
MCGGDVRNRRAQHRVERRGTKDVAGTRGADQRGQVVGAHSIGAMVELILAHALAENAWQKMDWWEHELGDS